MSIRSQMWNRPGTIPPLIKREFSYIRPTRFPMRYESIATVEQEAMRRGSVFSANFNRAKTKKYLIVRESRAGQSTANLWYEWCRLSNIPYIVSFTRKKYANVKMDLITTKLKFDSDTAHRVSSELAKRYAIVTPRDGFGWSTGPEIFGVFKIPIQYAEEIAIELMALPFVLAMSGTAVNPQWFTT